MRKITIHTKFVLPSMFKFKSSKDTFQTMLSLFLLSKFGVVLSEEFPDVAGRNVDEAEWVLPLAEEAPPLLRVRTALSSVGIWRRGSVLPEPSSSSPTSGGAGEITPSFDVLR